VSAGPVHRALDSIASPETWRTIASCAGCERELHDNRGTFRGLYGTAEGFALFRLCRRCEKRLRRDDAALKRLIVEADQKIMLTVAEPAGRA